MNAVAKRTKPMDFEKLLTLCRQEAHLQACRMYPEGIQRDKLAKKLTVKNFVTRICPIPVEELEEVCGF